MIRSAMFVLTGILTLTMVGVPSWAEYMAEPSPRLPRVKVMLGGEVFELEVATTTQTLRRGLMFRQQLADHEGMIFPFQPPRRVDFWMKNTLIPLDMIFTRGGQVVHVVHQATPCEDDPCPTYPSVHSVDMVLEVPGGTARRLAVQPGDPVRILPGGPAFRKDLPEAVPAQPLPGHFPD